MRIGKPSVRSHSLRFRPTVERIVRFVKLIHRVIDDPVHAHLAVVLDPLLEDCPKMLVIGLLAGLLVTAFRFLAAHIPLPFNLAGHFIRPRKEALPRSEPEFRQGRCDLREGVLQGQLFEIPQVPLQAVRQVLARVTLVHLLDQ